MKRVIGSSVEQPKYQIIIEVQLNDQDDVFSAKDIGRKGDLVEKRHSVAKEYQISDVQLQAYNDLVRSVMNIIKNNQFDIKKNYQSTSSYSYYIQVKPEFYEGIDLEPVEVKFRLSNHLNKSDESESDNPIIHTILINNEEFTNGTKIIQEIRRICRDLKAGDYSSVMSIK